MRRFESGINTIQTDSDNVIPQQVTETTHVSKVQLLYSQPVALGLLAELQTLGVEHLAEYSCRSS